MRIRRSQFVFLRIDEDRQLDVARLLTGDVSFAIRPVVVAAPLAAGGKELRLSDASLWLLLTVPRTWTSRDELLGDSDEVAADLRELVRAGLVITDRSDEPEATFRRREERLASSRWASESALFHYASVRRFDQRYNRFTSPSLTNDPGLVADYVDRLGPPPQAFYRRSETYQPLPLGEDRALASRAALRGRRTCRSFDQTVSMNRQALGTLLYETFGCHGTTDLGSGYTLLKRNCPSGGSLHPIEAYVLVRDVASLEPGIYHYGTADHGLALLDTLSPSRARSTAVDSCVGQAWAGEAHALVIMAARFDRVGWKYGAVARAYSVVMMDAGHLGQAFSLVATELGLGQFFTAAVDLRRIAQLLGLAEPAETPLAVMGCGPPRFGPATAALERSPYRPGGHRREPEDPADR